ncbi:MAG TPA: hypothetical protein VL240_05675 [Candidatus Binatia bacterium]|nr:hypothetical protein [Candidatus Binatia bacterium]
MVNKTGDASAAGSSPGYANDPAIEALNLTSVARDAAYRLKARFPGVVFTSGRRNRAEQASAMASNVVLHRNWIKETYIDSDAIRACQRWVDQHPEKKSRSDIAAGLTAVLDSLTDAQLSQVSKHLSGDAFDVQPVSHNGAAIKQMLRELTQKTGGKFLAEEGGLLRWHAQF